MPDGNDAHIRQIVELAVKSANKIAQTENDARDDAREERGLRAQLSMTEKVVGACLIALLGWVGFTVQGTDKKVAVIEARLSSAMEGRYTTSDASRDQQIQQQQIDSLDQRIDRLENYHGAER